jgi:triacylglycerol esterase/lipase EstA (alpha/beta hydrolase family)
MSLPLAAAVLCVFALPASANAITYAPIDHPGPRLDVPTALLTESLSCTSTLGSATRDPVLLIPGTTVDPPEAYSWNYEKALAAQGIPYCAVTAPNHTDGDIQIAAEYVVHAVRYMRATSHHKVVMFGWSQGASTLPRWALRFWPGIRPMVASLVGLAPLNFTGSVVASAACAAGSCVPAAWQQAVGSQFMAALDSVQVTFPKIAYTVIYTRNDDVVTPDVNGDLSVLPAGPNVTNVAIQSICPTDDSDHLTLVASPAAYAVAINAIDHPGHPADLAHVHVGQPCLPGTEPGVDPSDFVGEEAHIAADVGPRLTEGMVDKEPPLKCYVTATCPAARSTAHHARAARTIRPRGGRPRAR